MSDQFRRGRDGAGTGKPEGGFQQGWLDARQLADSQFDATDPDRLMLAGQGRQLVNQILAKRQFVHVWSSPAMT
jgi:hypothetical protein